MIRNVIKLKDNLFALYNHKSLIYSKITLNNYASRYYCQNIITCWNCKSNNSISKLFFCSNCGSLLEVNQNLDYFSLLGLTERYNINDVELTKNFRKLQSFLHPDKFSSKSEFEQKNSSEWSSLVNKAYQIISIPLRRAEYILQLNGITIPESNSSINKEFLMQMMEKNEEIEDATTSEEILKLSNNVKMILEDLIREFEIELKNNNLENSKLILIKMKYFASLDKSIKEKLNIMGIVK